MTASHSTPDRRQLHFTRTTKINTNPASSPLEPKIEFPAEDQGWMALQQHVIELTDKPIEDVQWNEIERLRQTLTSSELKAFFTYRRQRRLNETSALETVFQIQLWEEQECRKDYGWMLKFQDHLRAVVMSVTGVSENPHFELVLREIEKELLGMLKPYPDRTWVCDEGQTLCGRIICNLPRIFPDDQGLELLEKWWNMLEARGKEPEQKPLSLQGQQHLERLSKESYAREKDFERVFELGLQLGVIRKRGTSHHYFNGTHLGNGSAYGICLDLVRRDYELEAAIRVAVKAAANGKSEGSAPKVTQAN